MCRRIAFCLCAMLVALTTTTVAQDSIPQFMNIQGILLDSDGNPVTTPTDLTIKYYDYPEQELPTSEVTQPVFPDGGGRFCGVYPVGYSGASNNKPTGFIEMQIQPDPPMTPRISFKSVPFASCAQTISGDIQTSRGLLVMTDAAEDTTVKIDSLGNAHFMGDIQGGNSLKIKGNTYELVTSSGAMYLGREPGDFSDLQVGIGTQSPSATLHVEGTTYLNGVARVSGTGRLQSESSGGARILGEQGNTPSRPAIGFFSTNGVDDGGGGNGIYRPSANAMAFAVGSSERMRITGAGVGIGVPPVTTPTSALHVNGPIATSVSIFTGSATLLSNASVVLGNNSFATGAITFSLPAASTCAGRQIIVKKISPLGNGAVSVQGSGGDLIDGSSTQALNNQFDFFVLVSDGGSNWYIVGR